MLKQHHYISAEFLIDCETSDTAHIRAVNKFRGRYGSDPTINRTNCNYDEDEGAWSVTIRTDDEY